MTTNLKGKVQFLPGPKFNLENLSKVKISKTQINYM